MKIYTRTGDDGETSLIDGTRVSKSHLRLDTYGGLDELNSHIGLLIVHLNELAPKFKKEADYLVQIQNRLFDLGSHLALSDESYRPKLPKVDDTVAHSLELAIDELSAELPPLKNFILPGGAKASAQAHICRTVCRRAERACVDLDKTEKLSFPVIVILNRLSDYLFMLARAINHRLGLPSPEWKSR